MIRATSGAATLLENHLEYKPSASLAANASSLYGMYINDYTKLVNSTLLTY